MQRQEIPRACAQYNDAIGDIAIDGRTGAVLFDVAKAFGIDTKAYFPLHAEVYLTGEGKLSAVLYCADRATQGNTFDDLVKTARSEGNKLRLVKVESDKHLSPSEFFASVKRIDMQIRNASFPNDIELYIVGE